MTARKPEGTVGVPFLLSFDGPGRFKPGRGEAGWTVATVARADLAAFLSNLPRASWMPGTYRLAAEVSL